MKNIKINALASTFLMVVVMMTLGGCYHATVTTGLTPGTQVIDEPFAAGWVFGLVPPSTVDAASECAAGVAKVETQLSFVNQLVSGITFGIFTPMSIKVTCAASSSDVSPSIIIPQGAEQEEVIQSFSEAADNAVESGSATYVHFE